MTTSGRRRLGFVVDGFGHPGQRVIAAWHGVTGDAKRSHVRVGPRAVREDTVKPSEGPL